MSLGIRAMISATAARSIAGAWRERARGGAELAMTMQLHRGRKEHTAVLGDRAGSLNETGRSQLRLSPQTSALWPAECRLSRSTSCLCC